MRSSSARLWTRASFLLFAEIPANNIVKWTPGKGSSVFIHPSGYEGTDPYNGPEPGSNGMTLDAEGRVTDLRMRGSKERERRPIARSSNC
jgi:sugar lactone lactonase YvrE